MEGGGLSLRPYKFLIVAVVQKVENGEVVRELVAETPTSVFGVEGLRRFADEFERDLAIEEGEPDAS